MSRITRDRAAPIRQIDVFPCAGGLACVVAELAACFTNRNHRHVLKCTLQHSGAAIVPSMKADGAFRAVQRFCFIVFLGSLAPALTSYLVWKSVLSEPWMAVSIVFWAAMAIHTVWFTIGSSKERGRTDALLLIGLAPWVFLAWDSWLLTRGQVAPLSIEMICICCAAVGLLSAGLLIANHLHDLRRQTAERR